MAVNKNLVKDYAIVLNENTRLRKKIIKQDAKIDALEEENRSLKKELHKVKRELKNEQKKNDLLYEKYKKEEEGRKALEKELSEYKEALAKLNSLLNQNSDNSSVSTGTNSNKPRSEKKPKTANKYNGRKDNGRKRGGQPGHKGYSLTKKDLERLLNLSNVIYEIKDSGDPSLPYDSEFYLDLSFLVKITEHRLHQDSAQDLRAHRGSIFYGKSFKALSVLLNTEFNLSYHKIRKFLEIFTHGALHPSMGTVYNYCKEFSEKAKEKTKELTQDLLEEPILGTDSTVMIVSGKRRNIRVFTTPEKTVYQALESKRLDEMIEKTLLPHYQGILVHDHETSLFHFGKENSKCLVHEIRYLRKTQDDTGNDWSFRMEEFFQSLIHERKVAIAKDKFCFDSGEIESYTKTYREILEQGFKENKTTEFKFAKESELTLLKRLKKYEKNVLLFLSDFNIPPDNNLCESRLRGAKTKQKVTGGFRSMEGLEDYANSLTVIKNAQISENDTLSVLENYFD